MSQQQQRMTAQPRYIIAQPQQQNTQTPSNSQQLHTSPPNMLQNVRHGTCLSHLEFVIECVNKCCLI